MLIHLVREAASTRSPLLRGESYPDVAVFVCSPNVTSPLVLHSEQRAGSTCYPRLNSRLLRPCVSLYVRQEGMSETSQINIHYSHYRSTMWIPYRIENRG